MTRYDRQLVIVLLAGDARDEALVQAGEDLNAKAKSRQLPAALALVPAGSLRAGGAWRDALKTALGQLSDDSRVYVVGTSEWPLPSVSAWSANAAADLLAEAGMPAVRTVSIVSGQAGRACGSDASAASADDSFAADFHRRLRTAHGISVNVLARVDPVDVLGAEAGPDRGRKTTRGQDEASAGHRPRSKLRLGWTGEVQTQEWVNYDAPVPGSTPP